MCGRFLSSRGVLYVATRFGGSWLRRISFNELYMSGKWDILEIQHSAEMVGLVEKYAKGGTILDMGCGTGVLASRLDPSSFSFYRGVDSATQAIERARSRGIVNVDFAVGDIQTYTCSELFDLVVFEESLYYASWPRKRVLRRYGERLRKGGHFIVTIAQPRRFSGIIRMIRNNYRVVEDRAFHNSNRVFLVFSPREFIS